MEPTVGGVMVAAWLAVVGSAGRGARWVGRSGQARAEAAQEVVEAVAAAGTVRVVVATVSAGVARAMAAVASVQAEEATDMAVAEKV